MTEPQRTEKAQEPIDEPKAPEDHVEDLELDTDDAAAVKGGVASSYLWVGSKTGNPNP